LPNCTVDAGQIEIRLANLLGAVNKSLSLSQHVGDRASSFGFRSLLVHHRVAFIMLDTIAMDSVDGIVYDKYMDDFEYMVSEVESLLLMEGEQGARQIKKVSCWLGFIPPLFFTATKCRNSEIRHRAINALHLAPHKERMWTTCSAAQIA